MDSTPMDVELAVEAKFERTKKARGFEFLAAGDDTRKRFMGTKAESILAENGALI